MVEKYEINDIQLGNDVIPKLMKLKRIFFEMNLL